MIAGLAAWLDRAFLFAFEEFNQFRHRSFFDPEPFLAGMVGRGVEVAAPRRMSGRDKGRRLS
jgi:hypothetical protein